MVGTSLSTPAPPTMPLTAASRFARPMLLALAAGTPLLAQGTAGSATGGTVDSTLRRRRAQVLPALGSAPETGIHYGITVFALQERPLLDRSRPSVLLASAIRTAKSQSRASVEAERWTRGNDRRIAGTGLWQEYPLPFYGIGDEAPDAAKEIFAQRGVEASASVQQRLVRSLYGQTTLRVVDQSITPDSAGLLGSSGLTGTTGGRIVELALGALDDTRDNLFAPEQGRFVQLSYARSADAVGSDFSYGRLRLDARAYCALGGRGVVAGQLLAIGMDGNAPFDQIALVGGGDIMRGYARGRYRDQWFTGAQMEYRSPVRYRIGGVLFGGAGVVANRASRLTSGELLPTYGAGLRVQIDPAQRTAVRFDYGRGRDGNSGLYIGFNQAF
jgi:hypothetical protein